MSGTKTQPGKLIFYKRIQQGFKQEELCQGICSVSYLSKVENDKIEASDEIMRMLCERLGINQPNMHAIEQDAKQLINQLHQALIYREKEKIVSLYESLQTVVPQVQDVDVLHSYQLLSARYHILFQEFEKANILLQECKKMFGKYTTMHKVMFFYAKGLLCCKQGEWDEGVQSFVQCEVHARKIHYDEPGIYYNLAVAYSTTHNVTMSLYFLEQAMEGFHRVCKFRSMIDCQLIQGINYTRMQEYEKAIELYEHILRAADSFTDKEVICARVQHNLADLYAVKGDFQKAIELYLNSIEYENLQENAYVKTVLALVQMYMNIEDLELARKWISQGLVMCKEKNVEKKLESLLLMKRYKYFYEKGIYEAYLEAVAIPLFKKIGDGKELKKMYLELAKFSENMLEYKESSRYYKLAVATY